ncbi:MAG: type I secretion system permease/ATPase [Pseudomonadota bacterium]
MSKKHNPVKVAFQSLRKGFTAVALFSLALNILMLAGPLYMLQVYDRVLTSQSMETLIALSILLFGVFVVSGLLDYVRVKILNRLGSRFEVLAGNHILAAAMKRKISGKGKSGDNLLNDITSYRDFVSGHTLLAFFDTPWVPIYLGILFILHPYIGLLGLAGAMILTILALMNSSMSRDPMQETAEARQSSDALFESCERNAELVTSMGMRSDLARRWSLLNWRTSSHKTKATDGLSFFFVVSKTFRMALQSGMLGLGAALAIAGESSAGVMIAATIILGRALAPIDQAISQWRLFIGAVASYKKLKGLVEEFPEDEERIQLPKARSNMDVAIKQAGPPQAQRATLTGINFDLDAGDVVAVIGPSGSGKSTLARMLTGIWFPQRGEVNLDGSPTSKWNAAELGAQIGYLPQDVELFEGTIRENISRFAADATDEAILKAAQDADVHDMILNLPDGYETVIGTRGTFLSGGQRQRIGLARALYGDPFIIVLDEPNSNLDATGDTALMHAVMRAQARGAIVVVMTHRPSTLQAVNKVLVLDSGQMKAFGPKEQVLRSTTRAIVNNSVPRVTSANNQPEQAGKVASK